MNTTTGMPNLHKSGGFTLIEVMVVVAIIGTLAAFAIPSYLHYTTRAKTVELISFAASFRSELGEYVSRNGHFPTKSTIDNPTDLIRKIEFYRPQCDDLWIHVYPTKKYHPIITPGRQAFIYRGVIEAGGTITWLCTFHPTFRKMPTEFFPSSCKESITNDTWPPQCNL